MVKRRANKMSSHNKVEKPSAAKKTRSEEPSSSPGTLTERKGLPVTLLSGFLGSGKTTLLEHILASPDHGLRIAVIVNDMSKLNIDAELIKKHSVASSHEKLIQLQNGCICCTLRGDLLEELVRLAKDGKVEYVVIESTGISEPEQVAETFTAELANALVSGALGEGEGSIAVDEKEMLILKEIADMGGLTKLAYLDTCVTVVDAYNLFNNLHTADFLSDRWGKDEEIAPEDERTISDLLVDQIEFASIILVNKIDQVDDDQRKKVLEICAVLNPSAKVIETRYSRVDVKEVINTGLYDYGKAKMGSGWLKSLHELSLRNVGGKMKMAPKPETEEYGITSFIYQARRPFHPKRLFDLVHDKFILLQNTEQYDDDSDAGGEEANGNVNKEKNELPDRSRDSTESLRSEKSSESDNGKSENDSDTDVAESCSEVDLEHSDDEALEDVDELADKDFSRDVPVAEILGNKASHDVFKTVYRSKGFWWHANRPTQQGEWSQAGGILTTSGGSPWFCALDRTLWPTDKEVVDLIDADFAGPWGDRRQEIVFIGERLNSEAITRLFDHALLNDREMKRWEKIVTLSKDLPAEELKQKLDLVFEDGWEDWPTTPLGGNGDDDHGHQGGTCALK